MSSDAKLTGNIGAGRSGDAPDPNPGTPPRGSDEQAAGPAMRAAERPLTWMLVIGWLTVAAFLAFMLAPALA